MKSRVRATLITTALLLLNTVSANAAEIHEAVITDDAAKVRLLLKKNPAHVNLRDERGETPLCYARTRSMVELLLSSGADINARDEDRQTPLIAMSIASFTDGVGLLISKKADVNAKD